ncbi:MAG: 2-phospho-L-lactate transferase [Candidatus Binataceae bacterium]
MLAGGVGAAKFLRGLARAVPPERIAAVVNTGDDEIFHGLHVSPDLDTITYTLADAVNREQGWGLEGDSFNALAALGRFYESPWFRLGDRDLATHIYRTDRMRARASLEQVTAEIAEGFGVRAQVLPMSNDRVRTFVKLHGRPALPFQEYFVRGRARGTVERVELRGIESARPLPAAIRAIRASRAVIIAPSNPFVSIGPILGLPGMRDELRRARPRVAAISPIVRGMAIKGPAAKMLRGLGMEVSALGVARLYRDDASLFVIDHADRRLIAPIERLGMRVIALDTIMASPARAARLAAAVLKELGV